jgi:hemerythrin-like domain-containing protein
MTEPFKLLKKDHDTVKAILKELLETTNRATHKRSELLATLKEELQLHEEIEEQLFYPPLKAKSETKDLILEAYEEHSVVDDLLAKIAQIETNDETWKAKITVLQECLKHHIKEEETQIFPKAKAVLSQVKLKEIATGIEAMKQENK